jgi:alcohol dehydrogenase (cytochrome c)
MKIQICALLATSAVLQAQGVPPQANREAVITPVPFERIQKAAAQEPQNWLTYSGGYSSNRHSQLSQITPENAKDLTLKWVFQARSLEKHEVTPLVVDGVMYTVQGINDVIALNAVTGKTIWTHPYKPSPDARNCCGQETRGLAILGDKLFLATTNSSSPRSTPT